MVSSAPEALTARQQQIVDVAATILEAEGPNGLTMRRLASELGIKAPSLYKHFPDKSAVEAALIERGFRIWGERARQVLAEPGDRLANLASAYRSIARDRPYLYRLLTTGALDRSRIAPGLEAWSGAPIGELFIDGETARAFWAFLHGMAILEIDRRFPPSSDLDRAWSNGLAAFRALSSS
ncbi:MAG TPA: TetR/AcrR family transcriptional regulator [Thermomicrobiales bacterium]|nr:TetR/AcrR family transcriptional regulator [Thermomicrobiales bacterium]